MEQREYILKNLNFFRTPKMVGVGVGVRVPRTPTPKPLKYRVPVSATQYANRVKSKYAV